MEDKNFEVDGIKLDRDNQEFQYALQFVLESKRNLYLTGKAGSGKTTFLKYLKKVSEKEMAIVAPTGVAAVNAGGQTIHSFFKIEPSLYVPGDKRLRKKAPNEDEDKSTIYDNFSYSHERIKIMRKLELLVIDEISMVRADLLDVVDTLLRVYREDPAPFGGVQVVFIGDSFQLPPVLAGEEKDLFYQFYDSEYFFSAKAIQKIDLLYIELKKIYRQNEEDFIDLLNRVRVGQMIQDDYRVLNSRLRPGFRPNEQDNYIVLATTNNTVTKINDDKLEALQTPLKSYMAHIEGVFPESSRPTETELRLKVGSQVMFVKNNWEKRYYNGKIGTVTELKENEITVEVDAGHGERRAITAQRELWQNKKYDWDSSKNRIVETVIGSFQQFPLRLAWAITVHKSQGLTFERVIANIGSTFAPGQAYVALSRCTSMNGLVLTSPIRIGTVITDPRVLKFAQKETPDTLLTEQLAGCRADNYYNEARKAFRAQNAEEAVDSVLTAIKYRNDLESDSFRRYTSIWLKRLFQSVALSKERKATIDEQKQRIQEYTERMTQLEDVVRNKDFVIATTTEQLHQTKETVDSLEVEVKAQGSILNQKLLEIDVLKKELERVRNIKWYEKLFGKH